MPWLLQEEAKGICKILQLSDPAPEAALQYLLQHCTTAVVTLGPQGCLAGTQAGSSCSSSSRRLSSSLSRRQHAQAAQQQDQQAQADASQGAQSPLQQQLQAKGSRAGTAVADADGLEIVRQPGVAGVKVVDVTGAGDMFAAG